MILTKRTAKVFGDIERVLRDSLELDVTEVIGGDFNLTTLNKDIDGTDILDIYQKLGLDFMKYASGERLNEKGIEFLENVGDFILIDPNCTYLEGDHLYELAKSQTIKDYIRQLKVNDLVHIKQYTEMLKTKKCN